MVCCSATRGGFPPVLIAASMLFRSNILGMRTLQQTEVVSISEQRKSRTRYFYVRLLRDCVEQAKPLGL
jgi:hypothetical protein